MSDPSFIFFQVFNNNFIMYTYFTCTPASSTIIDDVTNYVIYKMCNTNL